MYRQILILPRVNEVVIIILPHTDMYHLLLDWANNLTKLRLEHVAVTTAVLQKFQYGI